MSTLDGAPATTARRIEDYPRYPLLLGPSPIHRLDRLTKHLGGATIWAKHDDQRLRVDRQLTRRLGPIHRVC